MEIQKNGEFYNVYPHSEKVCHKLVEILTKYDMNQFIKIHNITKDQFRSYLDPTYAIKGIPDSFIQQVYELTNFDISSFNKLAYPEYEMPDPNSNPAVSFDEKIPQKIRQALKDKHNHELFSDIATCISFPKELDQQIRKIFHYIVGLCTAMPYYQLLKEQQDEERISSYINNNFSETPSPSKKTCPSTNPNTKELPYIKDKRELERQSKRQQLLIRAQRAHFYNQNYVVAKKLYLKIIQDYPESEECYIACLSLLSIYKSRNDWNLNLESTTTEARILKRLTDDSVWRDICKIFKDATTDKRTKHARKRSQTNIYKLMKTSKTPNPNS